MANFKKMTLALASLAPTVLASSAATKMTVGVVGDFGWTGWKPAPLSFCNDVMPRLIAKNITIPREVQNDCDPGDRAAVSNATALQGKFSTSLPKNPKSALLTLDQPTPPPTSAKSAKRRTSAPPVHPTTPTTCTAPTGPRCSSSSTQTASSRSTRPAHPSTRTSTQSNATQVAFLEQAFAASKAEWKFLQLHHGYMSAATNNTDVAPLIAVVEKHGGVVLNGHDHCLAHFYNNNTNFILAGGAGYPQVEDCNYGVPLGPYTKWLGANSQSAANGFVTMDISREEVNVEYYARDMKFEGGDLYPVKNDMTPSYSFKIKTHARSF